MEGYNYVKERRKFGRPCAFTTHTGVTFSERPNPELIDDYVLRNPVHRGTQLSKEMALSEVLTDNAEYASHGCNHVEGGWPKDVNYWDEEMTTRHRKKVMRDDIWVQKLTQLVIPMEHGVRQNAAVNIYQQYFEEMDNVRSREDFAGRTVSIFKDQFDDIRPIQHLSWTTEMGVNIAAAYCDPNHLTGHLANPASFIWSIENSNAPLLKLEPKSALFCIEYNPKDSFILAGGQHSGQVAVWDTRTGGQPTLVSEPEVCHTERVNCLLWTASKTFSDFFSGSSDGSLRFWDTRAMKAPVDILYTDIEHTNDQDRHRAHGISVLEYEPTIPTKYMIGTEQGFVFVCNRKADTPTEKITSRFRTQVGQVNSLERNPAFLKNFLTVGDYCAKMWSDEYKDAQIVWTSNCKVPYLYGTWSGSRCTVFFIARYDGTLEVWDLLIRQDEPVLQLKLADTTLNTIRTSDQTENVAIGDGKGVIHLMKFSDNLNNIDKIERATLSNLFERETRREKYYDARMREMRMKFMQKTAVKSEKSSRRSSKRSSKSHTSSRTPMDALMESSEEEDAVVGGGEEGGEQQEGGGGFRIRDAEMNYVEAVAEEKNRRNKNTAIITKTPFAADFDYTTILKPEELEKEHENKIRDIKAKVVKGVLDQYRQQENQT